MRNQTSILAVMSALAALIITACAVNEGEPPERRRTGATAPHSHPEVPLPSTRATTRPATRPVTQPSARPVPEAATKPAAKPTALRPNKAEPRDLPAFLGPLRKPKDPPENPTTEAKLELGRMLYYDPRISGNGAISCASCHNPGLGFADGLAKGVGFNGRLLDRNSPTVLNAAYYKLQFWDGRAASLEEQAKGPIQNPNEMNATPEHVLKTITLINAIPEYRRRFNEAFGGEATLDRVAQAIATFERACVDLDSPFDRYARWDDGAVSEGAKRGLGLFTLQAGCAVCHSGPNLADDRFHNIGLGDGDRGRAAVTGAPEDEGAFKTPTLRNIALTGPYMHDGSQKTLREVIDHYERVTKEKDKHPNLSLLLRDFKLTEEQKRDLEAFMLTLTGDKRDPRINVVPPLPQMEPALDVAAAPAE